MQPEGEAGPRVYIHLKKRSTGRGGEAALMGRQLFDCLLQLKRNKDNEKKRNKGDSRCTPIAENGRREAPRLQRLLLPSVVCVVLAFLKGKEERKTIDASP